MRTPPRISEWILYHLLEKEEREFIIGDLKEIYGQVCYSSGELITMIHKLFENGLIVLNKHSKTEGGNNGILFALQNGECKIKKL